MIIFEEEEGEGKKNKENETGFFIPSRRQTTNDHSNSKMKLQIEDKSLMQVKENSIINQKVLNFYLINVFMAQSVMIYQ